MARRVLLALALGVLAGSLTACGVRNTIDPVAAAATKSQDAGGYKTTMSITVSADGRELTMAGEGQVVTRVVTRLKYEKSPLKFSAL